MGYGEIGPGGSLQWMMHHKHPRWDPEGAPPLRDVPEKVTYYDVDKDLTPTDQVTFIIKASPSDVQQYGDYIKITVPLGESDKLVRIYWKGDDPPSEFDDRQQAS